MKRICGLYLLTALAMVAAPSLHALSSNYYRYSCPGAEKLVRKVVEDAVKKDNGIGASLLRMFFHDCFVEGCDGSVLLDSYGDNVAEKDAPANNPSLRGYDVIDYAKYVVEAACPGVVSCADIIAFAARDAVHMLQGPYWDVPGGRYDGKVSTAANAAKYLPAPFLGLDELTKAFEAKGLTWKELGILSGAHTIGISHCSSFKARLYNASSHPMDFYFKKYLISKCPEDDTDDSARINMDYTPLVFDNSYYRAVRRDEGLFDSDAALLDGQYTSSDVFSYADDADLFFHDFPIAMLKLGAVGVKSSKDGEIRRYCRYVN